MSNEKAAFDSFANRLKAQYEREGKPRTDREIRKECESIAYKVEAKEREKKKESSK
jgi:hypothetical protein